jgi:hypothetical protein
MEARTMSETAVGTATTAFPGKYLSITSFRRDGTGKATPVWFVQQGGRLLVETDAAELLPDAETGRVERLMARKYRVDLVFIKPIRSLQAARHPGRPRGKPVILAITPR